MKTWWKIKAWPWLKENWWVILLLPVMAIVGLGMGAMWMLQRRAPTIIDPTAKADERAEVEAARRVEELTAERDRLSEQLREVEAKYAGLQVDFERRLAGEVEALRADPEKLRQAMLRAGRGQ